MTSYTLLRGCVVFASLGLVAACGPEPKSITARVVTNSSHHSIDEHFCSVAMSGKMCSLLDIFNTSSPKLQNLARGLAPATARIGGYSGNFIIYQNDDGSVSTNDGVIQQWEEHFCDDFYTGQVGQRNWSNINCTGNNYHELNNFFVNVGWEVTYQINDLLRYGEFWDTFNAKQLIQYLKNNNLPVQAYSLPNEPNRYLFKFNKLYLAFYKHEGDVGILRDLLDQLGLENVKIYGPDVASLQKYMSSRPFLSELLETPTYCDMVDAITVHHYYLHGKTATKQNFTDPVVYDAAKRTMTMANDILTAKNCNKPLIVSETASASKGGVPNLSNRYAGAMMWLDEMAVVALYRGSRINRHTFWRGNNGMLDQATFDPTPSYWVSVLWKRLIVGPVLNASYHQDVDGRFRLYAHCAKVDGQYTSTPGAIVVYYINLMDSLVELLMHGYLDVTYKLFSLSHHNGLQSNEVFLNGAPSPLALVDDNLPDIQPQTQNGGPIGVGPYGMGFVLIENAGATACTEMSGIYSATRTEIESVSSFSLQKTGQNKNKIKTKKS